MTALSSSSYGWGSDVDGLDDLRGLGQRLGVARHLEVHADLEELERRQLTDRLGAGLSFQDLQRAVEAERRVRLGRDREPHVELVVAQVVVRDAGVRVDDLGRAPRVLGVDLGGDEHRLVAERARVEDRRDLADDALLDQLAHAREDRLLLDAEQRGDLGVRARHDPELALHRVQQLLVELVERNGRAVLARADLGGHCSHWAASFA